MPLLDLVRDVKAGKLKLSQVRPGLQKHVKRLIPVVGAAPVARVQHVAVGKFGARHRTARST